jgi:hypothetical protein
MTFKIASGCLDRIIERLRPFAGRTANVAFVTVPSAPHRPGFAFFDVYRIPNTPFGIIVLMDFLYRHRTSFRLRLTSRRTRAGTSSQFTAWRLAFGVCGLEGPRVLGQSTREAFKNETCATNGTYGSQRET